MYKKTNQTYHSKIDPRIVLKTVEFYYTDVPVGRVLYVDVNLMDRKTVYIEEIMIYPEFKNKGYSEKIIKDMAQFVVDLNINVVDMQLSPDVTFIKKYIDKYTSLARIKVNYR